MIEALIKLVTLLVEIFVGLIVVFIILWFVLIFTGLLFEALYPKARLLFSKVKKTGEAFAMQKSSGNEKEDECLEDSPENIKKIRKYLESSKSKAGDFVTKMKERKRETVFFAMILCTAGAFYPLQIYSQSSDAWKTFERSGCQEEAIEKFIVLAKKYNKYINTTYEIMQGCELSTLELTRSLRASGKNTRRVRYEHAMVEWARSGDYIHNRKWLVREFKQLGATEEANAVQTEIDDLREIARLEKASDVKLWDDVLKPTSLIDFVPLPQTKGKTVVKGIRKFNQANRAWKAAKAAKNSFSAFARGRRIRKAKRLKQKEQIADYKRCLKESVSEHICRKEFIRRINIK